MQCIYPERVNITNALDADAGRLLIQNGALSQEGTFPVVRVLSFRPIVCMFMLSVILELFEAIVRTRERRVSDEMHKFVMLTIGRPDPFILGLDFWVEEDSDKRRFSPT